jgi:flagellar biosynthetic protein FliR
MAVSLLLARVAAFVTVIPIFGGTRVPRTVKVGLAIALTLTWIDHAALLNLGPTATTVSISWVGFLLAVAKEVLLGTVLGYMLGLILVPAQVAGEFIAQQMAMTIGTLADPTAAQTTGIITQILEVLAIALFLGLDGDHVVLSTFAHALKHWPVGSGSVPLPMTQILSGSARAEEWGLQIAAPLSFCLFFSSIVLALMARAAPQMNVFSVGFSLQVGIGLAGLALFLPQILRSMNQVFASMTEIFVLPG